MGIKNLMLGVIPKNILFDDLKNHVKFVSPEQNDFDLSAFDLHLGEVCHLMKAGVKLLKGRQFSEISKDPRYVEKTISLKEIQTLEPKRTYVIEIQEHFNLEKNNELYIYGQATGRSSIGRLDVLTRLIVDEVDCYDKLLEDYSGPLHIEVTPITFPIKVKKGTSLNQLRLFRGDPDFCKIKKEELLYYGELLCKKDKPDSKLKDKQKLTVDLTPTEYGSKGKKAIAFAAKKKNNFPPIDLTNKNNKPDPKLYWEPIPENDGSLMIEPERFYILRSKERIRLPLDVAVYCQAVTEDLGEIRIHYAGFVHPGFGFYREGGTPLIFEVRGHNVKTFLQDGETLARIVYYKMAKSVSEEDARIADSYGNQELKLSNYFKDW